ncbi:MAG: hypothetical protein K8T89_13595 [Planctomycetes bacterium]|nr:hypothetical protein [Planctomycetota bacterium]
MHFQFIVAPPTPTLSPPVAPTTESTADLLRQLIDIQREQLGLLQTTASTAGDGNQVRWRNFFERWHDDFPEFPASFREVLPAIERAYLRLMDEMVHHLKDEERHGLEDDFSLGEFLDRFAIRASQIGSILNLLGQMSESVRSEE